MAEHTSGPWHVFTDDGKIDRYPGIDAGDKTIVVWGDEREPDLGVQGDTPEQSLANARLIAGAPELLAAAMEAAVALQEAGIEICRYADHDPRAMGYVESARRALAAAVSKAEGK